MKLDALIDALTDIKDTVGGDKEVTVIGTEDIPDGVPLKDATEYQGGVYLRIG